MKTHTFPLLLYHAMEWKSKTYAWRIGVYLKNIDITRPVPRMRTIPQVKKEFPDLQLSERYLRSLVREHKVVCVQVGVKTLINLDSLFAFLNGQGA